ncbi:MAG: sigma-70 family RNA polymerase sigma factor [Myxococcota bacterium]|nr:sigma-70 family RNA polymerase sigma factor [Myxococcota bacterium]
MPEPLGEAATSPTELTDAILLARMGAGDREALAEIYRRFGAYLLGVAVRFVSERQEAEDLVHDVFVEAWLRAGQFDPARGSARAWLAARLRSRAIDHLRGSKRHGELDRERAPTPAAFRLPDAEADHERARAALATLTPAQRVVLELAYFSGLSTSEIAGREGIPHGTVKSRMAAGLARLREELCKGGPS